MSKNEKPRPPTRPYIGLRRATNAWIGIGDGGAGGFAEALDPGCFTASSGNGDGGSDSKKRGLDLAELLQLSPPAESRSAKVFRAMNPTVGAGGATAILAL